MENDGKVCLSPKEVGHLLGLSKNSVYKGVLAGEIPHIKVGKRILIPKARLLILLEGKVQNEINK